jgi:hypothetical protein
MNRFPTLRLILAAALAALAALALPAAAVAKDRNNDRIPDRWEKRHHLSLEVKQTARDQDRDRLRNRAEFLAGDDPRDSDSDDDGVMDGEENAGTIQSFDPATGRLTIALFGDDAISGLVTDATRIKCEDEPGEDHQGEDHHGENSGPGSEHSGPSGHDDEVAGANCTTADLVVGAVVEEAELELEHGVATFDEVELAD